MEAKLIPDRILCATHPDEVVIRVSVNPEDTKLFYCRECLPEPKPELIKYQDLLQHLSMQYINQDLSSHKISLPQKIEDFHKDQKQIETEISEQISQEKQKVDEGIKKIEKQFAQLIKALKEATYKKIEGFSKSFNGVCEEFSRRVNCHDELSAGTKNVLPTKEALYNKILGSAGSSTEVENNLKAALNELQIKKASADERNVDEISKMKKKLEETVVNTFIIPPKTQKDYETRIKNLQSLLEALLFGLKEDLQIPDDGSPDLHAEMMRHIKSGKSLETALQTINKSFETKNAGFQSLLDDKFQVVVAKPVCPGSEAGLTPSEAKAYKCKTCHANSSDLGDSDVICESCKGYCHKGHDVEYVGVMSYYCQCQFTMGICQLSSQCSYKFTTSSYYRMATYKCKVCEMASSRILCGYCARMCHKEHGTTYNGIQSTYCDCRGLFTFCKYHEQNPNPSS